MFKGHRSPSRLCSSPGLRRKRGPIKRALSPTLFCSLFSIHLKSSRSPALLGVAPLLVAAGWVAEEWKK